MRILNRPMFRYGGPIKEGIMQGMRNGGRAALVGNPVYPQTRGREHHQENIYDSSIFEGPIVVQAMLYEQKQKLKRYVPKYKKISDFQKAYEQKLENERALTDSLAIENWAGSVSYLQNLKDESGTELFIWCPGDKYNDLDYLSSEEGKKAFVRKEIAEQEKKIAQA